MKLAMLVKKIIRINLAREKGLFFSTRVFTDNKQLIH